MDLTVSFGSTWSWGYGGLIVRMAWNAPAGGASSFKLYADGRRLRTVSGGTRAWSEYVFYGDFFSMALLDKAIEEYFAEAHTYTVVASSSSGEVYDEIRYVPADVLNIENRVLGLSDDQTRELSVQHALGADEGIDGYDVPYEPSSLPISSTIISVVRDPRAHVYYGLTRDVRPKGSVGQIDFRVGLESVDGNPVQFSTARDNVLAFALPRQRTEFDFHGRSVTIQQYDPLDPSLEYPVYDVRCLVNNAGGILPLPPLQGSYESGVPYAFFTLSFTREVSGDLSRDQVLNLRDFTVLARGWRQADRPTVADIAGRRGMGMPDGNVNGFDLRAFCRDWVGDVDGFESRGLESLGWIGEGNAYWTVVSSQGHSGRYCARAGRIGDNQRSRLLITVECRAGQISFWRKVSSEARYDFLRFRSGGTVLGEWSGELDWARVSFPVEAGKRTFSWDYVKDNGGSMGSDTAWIDLVSFPTSILGTGSR